MKAKDLMIGDWVLSPSGNQRIREITYESSIGYCVWLENVDSWYPCKIEDIKPIQLTDKILLASGFTLGEYILPFSGRDIGKYSYANVTEKKVQECVVVPITKNCSWSFSSVDGTDIPVIQYVHELQHTLRLCGIDKEIELW